MAIEITSRSGQPITNIQDWERLASSPGRWQGDYSAMELARLWLDGAGPRAVVDLLSPALSGLSITRAEAEPQVKFDPYRGGVRNHDVLAFGQADVGNVVIGVEGKVNEPLDTTIRGKLAQAQRRRDRGENTNLDRRVKDLLWAFAGCGLDEEPRLGDLRYQLFSGLAGTLAAAEADTKAAAFVVQLISTPVTKPTAVDETRAALSDFTLVVYGEANDPLAGPLRARSKTPWISDNIDFWIGLVETSALPRAAADDAPDPPPVASG